ncbi:amino acid ABC transporter substrate-binding protein [Streptacidiphilus pinicola]|uniref:Amino acid ABC transporter substrate-binding protein n=1 Tax=Streptacidiphilus pinicola TaxID=2219663 RepID=A0A2X0KIM0_9ACTN|nr:ABC transporter substrate-binding protein [Streptacidiphilus pinicola]RAG86590.1 amino acid ABC transporter substrate-binding protein [Streptacidiphilus pinicola]
MNALLKTSRLLSAAAGAAVLVLAAGCAPQSSGNASGTASGAAGSAATCTKGGLATLASGKLTVGTDDPAYDPWFDNNKPSDGKGFESAVAYAVAKQLGYDTSKVTWTVAPFNSVIAPGQKKFDFDINEVSITDERRNAVDFSSGYYDVRQAVITLKDSKYAGATGIAALKGAKIGAQVGTTSLNVAQKTVAPSQQVAVFDTTDEASAALKNHQIDALVADLPTAFYITSAQVTDAKIVGQFPTGSGTSDGKPEQFGLVLGKGSALTSCVSQAVDALKTDGTLDQLAKQWLPASDAAPVLK